MTFIKLVKNFVKDKKEAFHRRFPGPLEGLPHHGLSETQVYPKGNNFGSAIGLATKKRFADFQMGSNTLMASIGTCFAEEFATFMKENAHLGIGTYLYKEKNAFNSSANWGRVYTIRNFLQIVQYSLTDKIPVYVEKMDNGFIDPLRDNSIGKFNLYEDAVEQIKSHRNLSAEVFKTCQTLVLTLGQNEGWLDIDSGMIWGSMPRGGLRKEFPGRFNETEFGYVDNLKDLEAAIDILVQHNKGIKIIITVSPVAAHATFLTQDVVTQSFAGKCQLRAVVHQIQKKSHERIFYFPSFEMVLCDNPLSFRADNRHVKRWKVKEIFSLLGSMLKK